MLFLSLEEGGLQDSADCQAHSLKQASKQVQVFGYRLVSYVQLAIVDAAAHTRLGVVIGYWKLPIVLLQLHNRAL